MSAEPLADGFYEIHRWCQKLELHPEAPDVLTVLAREDITINRRKPHLWQLTRNKDGTYTLLNAASELEGLYLGIDDLQSSSHIRVLGSDTPQKWLLKPFGTQDRYYIVLDGEAIKLNGQLFELVVDLPNWDHPKTAIRPMEAGQISQTWVFSRVR